MCEGCLLVKHGPVAAEEAVLGGAGHDALVVLDGQADVEDLRGDENIQVFQWLISGLKPMTHWQHNPI